jgi:hypothetical protein
MAKEKWMQKAVNPQEKGEFRRKLVRAGLIPKGGKVTIEAAERMKEIAKKRGDTETVQQAQFAINAIRINQRRKK